MLVISAHKAPGVAASAHKPRTGFLKQGPDRPITPSFAARPPITLLSARATQESGSVRCAPALAPSGYSHGLCDTSKCYLLILVKVLYQSPPWWKIVCAKNQLYFYANFVQSQTWETLFVCNEVVCCALWQPCCQAKRVAPGTVLAAANLGPLSTFQKLPQLSFILLSRHVIHVVHTSVQAWQPCGRARRAADLGWRRQPRPRAPAAAAGVRCPRRCSTRGRPGRPRPPQIATCPPHTAAARPHRRTRAQTGCPARMGTPTGLYSACLLCALQQPSHASGLAQGQHWYNTPAPMTG